MKCDRCDQEATVHLTQVMNGQMQKMHLCADCAKELGVNEESGFTISDILLGKGAAAPLSSARSSVCESCGLTLVKFRKTGRFGCPACYQAFERELLPILRSMHHAQEHEGRCPRNREKTLGLRDRQEDLEAKLDQAVKDEDYERAAELRDELRRLEESRT